MFAGIFLIIKSKAAGMGKIIQYTHNPPQNLDRINYNYITIIIIFPGLEIAFSKWHGEVLTNTD